MNLVRRNRYVVLAVCGLFSLLTLYSIRTNSFESPIRPQLSISAPAAANDSKPTSQTLLDLVNTERRKAGLKPLALTDSLNRTAQAKSDDMVINGYGHIDLNGKHGYEFAHNATGCQLVSENIDAASTAEEAVQEWMSSKLHAEAIKNSQYVSTGFGIASYQSYYYITEHFASC